MNITKIIRLILVNLYQFVSKLFISNIGVIILFLMFGFIYSICHIIVYDEKLNLSWIILIIILFFALIFSYTKIFTNKIVVQTSNDKNEYIQKVNLETIYPPISYKIPLNETENPFDVNSNKKFYLDA